MSFKCQINGLLMKNWISFLMPPREMFDDSFVRVKEQLSSEMRQLLNVLHLFSDSCKRGFHHD